MAMILTYAKVMGLLFLTMGILGFIPGAAPHGELFGLFLMDTAHNILFLMTGLVLLAVGLSNQWESARRVTLGVAAVYGLLTLLGFVIPSHLVMGMPMNMSDDILHLAITASALMFGLPERYAYPQ
jgi:hypothetical protein